MPFTGTAPNKTFSRDTGQFSGSTAWAQTDAAGRGIESSDHDTHDQDQAAAINTSLQKDGSNKPTADIDWGGQKITNLGDPTSAQDAATKAYTDSVAVGFTNIEVRAASTANVTLASAVDDGSSFDDLTLATGDRILLKDQSDASENGLWIVAASGAPSRPTDGDAYDEYVGMIVNISVGTANANTAWRCTNNAGGTLETDDLDFAPFGSAISLPLSVGNGGGGGNTAADSFNNLKQAATSGASGVVELSTNAEAIAGTDTSRAITPANASAVAQTVVALSDGATPALDASLGNVFSLTAAGNRTIGIPTNPVAGKKIVIMHLASGGARTLSLNSGTGGFRFGEDIASLSSTTSGKTDYIGAIYNATANKWDVVAVSKGY
jgi:hypothetical protein